MAASENSEEMVGMPKLSEQDFHTIAQLVYQHSGITLSDKKKALVIGRLNMTLKNLGMSDFGQYCKYLAADSSGEAINHLLDRITTNHTFFYREEAHFEFMRNQALPEWEKKLKAKGERDLRVWSAGCATGEEAYLLAMLLLDFFALDYGQWDAGVLATDISDKALTAALAGSYNDEKLGQLPQHFRNRYLRKEGSLWVVNDRLRKEVTFRKLNLMGEFPFKKKFHLIFCRNVMIYFDQPIRDQLVKKLIQVLEPGGYLFIGHSETLRGFGEHLKYVMPALYQKL